MNPLVIMGCMASNNWQLGPVSKLFTITVGQIADKFGSFRGYSRLDSPAGNIDSNVFDGYTIIYLAAGNAASSVFDFQVQFIGNTSDRLLNVTPQNYGDTLRDIAGTYNSALNRTSYSRVLPNSNLYNNWAQGSIRTCLLEWA